MGRQIVFLFFGSLATNLSIRTKISKAPFLYESALRSLSLATFSLALYFFGKRILPK
jgi:hypothetical protein